MFTDDEKVQPETQTVENVIQTVPVGAIGKCPTCGRDKVNS